MGDEFLKTKLFGIILNSKNGTCAKNQDLALVFPLIA